ncbi:MAG: PASTA domain-containing protein, partial [Lachnospiraceae bacterium]|nr:PASTA domain-containing protein [Lachnospiraceae bacterium]
ESQSDSESEIVSQETETEDVVPMINIVGMSLEEATQALEELGIEIFIAASRESEEEEGTILEQSVQEGVEIKVGDSVTVVTAGKHISVELQEVPNVVGLSEKDAVNKLNNKGFVPVKEYKLSDTVDKGDVISQSIDAGDEVEPGTTVVIVISQGKELVKVPTNLVGKYGDEVVNILQDLGFKVVVYDEKYHDDYEVNEVYKVDKAGKELEEGSTVKVYVSLGPKPKPSESESESTRPSESESESTRPSESESESTRPSESESESTRPSESESESTRPSESESESTKPSESESESTKPVSYKFSQSYSKSGASSYKYILSDANGEVLKQDSGSGNSITISKSGIKASSGRVYIQWYGSAKEEMGLAYEEKVSFTQE